MNRHGPECGGAIVKYPLADGADCHALLRALKNARIVADFDGFAAFDRNVGDSGLPLLIIGSCPVHTLMLEWFGYERFFYAMADCLVTAPLVPQTMEDCDQAWRRHIVCWGGLPSILFDPGVSETQFHEHLRNLFAFTYGKSSFIIGASDNVMPGACWDHICAIGEIVGA